MCTFKDMPHGQKHILNQATRLIADIRRDMNILESAVQNNQSVTAKSQISSIQSKLNRNLVDIINMMASNLRGSDDE